MPNRPTQRWKRWLCFGLRRNAMLLRNKRSPTSKWSRWYPTAIRSNFNSSLLLRLKPCLLITSTHWFTNPLESTSTSALTTLKSMLFRCKSLFIKELKTSTPRTKLKHSLLLFQSSLLFSISRKSSLNYTKEATSNTLSTPTTMPTRRKTQISKAKANRTKPRSNQSIRAIPAPDLSTRGPHSWQVGVLRT